MAIPLGPQWERLFGQEEMKVCILGLDNAGKTTVLYKITMGEVISTAPTVSLHVYLSRPDDRPTSARQAKIDDCL